MEKNHTNICCVSVWVIYYGQCIRVENFISAENCEWGRRPHSSNKCMFWHIKMLILRTAYLFTLTSARTLFHTSLYSVSHNTFALFLFLSFLHPLSMCVCARVCTENCLWFMNGMCLIAALKVRNWNELDLTEVFFHSYVEFLHRSRIIISLRQ